MRGRQPAAESKDCNTALTERNIYIYIKILTDYNPISILTKRFVLRTVQFRAFCVQNWT